jgi:hypothetical protein
MAICINCHTTDKGFFAPRCHACNEECSFLMQCAASLVWTLTYIITTLGLMWLIVWLLFG